MQYSSSIYQSPNEYNVVLQHTLVSGFSHARSLLLFVLGPSTTGSSAPSTVPAAPVPGIPLSLIVVRDVTSIYSSFPATAAASAIMMLCAGLFAQYEFLCGRREGGEHEVGVSY